MRSLFFTLCLALILTGGVWAQQKPDVIIKRDGTKIEGMVSTISQTEIFYGTPDMPTNVFKTVPVAEVAAILYRDGKVQNFEAPAAGQQAAPAAAQAAQQQGHLAFGEPAPPAKAPFELYMMGKQDAKQYYTQYGGAQAGTLVPTILLGAIGGFIPAIAISATPPRAHRWNVPTTAYSNDPNYLNGYKEGARKKKSRKTWSAFGIGIGVNIVVALIFLR